MTSRPTWRAPFRLRPNSSSKRELDVDLPSAKGEPSRTTPESSGRVDWRMAAYRLARGRAISVQRSTADSAGRPNWFLTALHNDRTAADRRGLRATTVNIFADPAAAQERFYAAAARRRWLAKTFCAATDSQLGHGLGKRWALPWEGHSLSSLGSVQRAEFDRFNAQGVGASLLTSLTQSPNNFAPTPACDAAAP